MKKKPERRTTKSRQGGATPEKGGTKKRKRKQDALPTTEERLARAQAIAHVGDWEWDIVTNAVHWSDELYRIYGFEPRSVAPDYGLVLAQMHPESKEEFLQAIDGALKEDRHFEMDYRFFRKDGSEAVLHTIGQVVRDCTGAPVRMFGIVQEITERKRVEDALKVSEERYRFFLSNANDAVLIHTFDEQGQPGPFSEVSDLACAWTGYSREDFARMTPADLNDPAHLDHIPEVVQKLRTVGHAVFETVWIRKDGGRLPVEVSTRTMKVRDETYIVSLVRDTTERKVAETALVLREQQLAESQRIAHVGSWEHNLTTGTVVWSDELFRLLGLDPRRDPGDFKMFFDRIHPEDQPLLKQAIDETVRTGKHYSVDYRYFLPDGRMRILHAEGELKRDDAGGQLILSGTGQDMTERIQAEEKIRQNEQFIRSILNTVDEGFIVIDRDYNIVTANKAYCAQAGLPCEEVIGKHCFEISHKTSRPCYEEGEDCAVRHVFETGEPHEVLHRHTGHDRQVLYVETKAFPIKDAQGNITSAIETINNITEKHLLEEERLKSQKLESIGMLAGGIAHDFNNLLQGIFGYISMAKLTFENRERSLDMLSQAEKALQQSVNLTSQLLTFSKGGQPVKAVIDLRPVIENAAKFALSGSRSDLRLDIAPDLWSADADEGQIAQVVQNIVLNADQSMPLGGSVMITAWNVAGNEPGLPKGLARRDHVLVSIRDTGMGIPEANLSRIFDPYFSTKERGSGLGLATSYSIMRNHEGRLDVQSDLGEGSTFILALPALRVVAEAPGPAACSVVAVRPGRVLVMDDEDVVRLVAGELVKSLGHEAAFAENGETVIQAYRQAMEDGRPFDVVILDLTVRGGMGGAEAVKRLRDIDPEVKAVVSSGYYDDAITEAFEEHGFRAYLKKPYDIESLQRVLCELMN